MKDGILLQMLINSLSIAAHSTWLHSEEHDFLVDAGEGVATQLGVGALGAIKNIFLTHDHWDHVAGLVQLLNLRGRTENGRAVLPIYYPYGSRKLDTIAGMFSDRAEWMQMDAGMEIPIGKKRYIKPFPVRHAGGRAMGFQLWESRTRRKAEYSALTDIEMTQVAREMTAAGVKPKLSESYEYHIMTHTGDSKPLKIESIGNPEILIHEATYPLRSMIEHHEHSSLEDVVIAARESKAKTVVANHLSFRYYEFNLRERGGNHSPNVDVVDFGEIIPVMPRNRAQKIDTSSGMNGLRGLHRGPQIMVGRERKPNY